MVPKPMPSSRAMVKNTTVQAWLSHWMMYTHAASRKKLNTTSTSPADITCVIFPLSTSRPEKSRDTAMPSAMKVKKKPVEASISIWRAYMAT